MMKYPDIQQVDRTMSSMHADYESAAQPQLAALIAMLRVFSGPSRLEEAIEAALQRALESSTAVDSALVALVDNTAALRHAAVVGKHAVMLTDLNLQAPESPFVEVLAKGTTRYLSEPIDIIGAFMTTSTEQQIAGTGNQPPGANLPHALFIFPLRVNIQPVGILILTLSDVQTEMTPGELQLWEGTAALCALAGCSAKGERASSDPGTEEHDRLRSEVMATLSHELRTPLSTIKGCVTALLIDEIELPEDEQREFLRLIDEECDNMQIMISDLMDSALVDVGKLVLEPDLVRLPNLVQEIVNELQGRTSRHVFVVSFPSHFPLLTVDPHWIRQVFRNILDNAVKYSPEGGMIVIQTEVREKDVVISIVDQGVGIAPEDLTSLFDKYFRVKSATGPRVAGTGLGLPVARAIVEAHGGRIWAESKLGQGTTISFSLPLANGNSASHSTTQRE
jgi:signal transduction histidine kinase